MRLLLLLALAVALAVALALAVAPRTAGAVDDLAVQVVRLAPPTVLLETAALRLVSATSLYSEWMESGDQDLLDWAALLRGDAAQGLDGVRLRMAAACDVPA